MLIYKWTNKINGKIYIGKTTKTLLHRTKTHVNTTNVGSTLPIHNAIRKYGKEGFNIEVIATAIDVTELNELEVRFINDYDCRVPKGYNLKLGGENAEWHPASREKASISAKQRIKADGGAQLLSALAKGRETLKGKNPWNKGKKATEQAKKNQSEAHLGQIAWNKKAIYCVETKEQFESLHAAANALGLQAGHICSVLKGKRKATGGKTFRYATPSEKAV